MQFSWALDIIIISYLIYLIINKCYRQTITSQGSIMIKKSGLLIGCIVIWLTLLTLEKTGVEYWLGTQLTFGTDNISLYLGILGGIIIPISILSNWSIYSRKSNLYISLLLLVCLSLWTNFYVKDLLTFYIFFELILIPLFIIIGVFGSSEKTRGSILILIYTLVGSLCMLISICLSWYYMNSISFYSTNNRLVSVDLENIILFCILVGIFIKAPLFPLHIWLPIVHSESPLGGSIILASLVLKLTIYVILSWIIPVLTNSLVEMSPILLMLLIFTIIGASIVTITQIDLKVIIAYSSISHMGVSILGTFSNNCTGIIGGYILGIAHGLISPGLFICVGGILYERYHTRVMIYYNGLLNSMPLFSMAFIIISFANIGTPLTLNFIGEFLSWIGALSMNWIASWIAISVILLSSIYQFKLTSRLTGGTNVYIKGVGDTVRRENMILWVIIIASIIWGIMPIVMITDLKSF